MRQRGVVPGVAPEPRLRGEALEVIGDVLRDGLRVRELRRVVAADLAERPSSEIREMPGHDEVDGRRLARPKPEFAAESADQHAIHRRGGVVPRHGLRTRLAAHSGGVLRRRAEQGQAHRAEAGQFLQVFASAAGRSLKVIRPTLTLPQAPFSASTISRTAVFPKSSSDVEGVQRHAVAVRAGGRACDLAVDEEVQARPAGVVAAAEPEVDEAALDGERPAGELAGGRVLRRRRCSPGAKA